MMVALSIDRFDGRCAPVRDTGFKEHVLNKTNRIQPDSSGVFVMMAIAVQNNMATILCELMIHSQGTNNNIMIKVTQVKAKFTSEEQRLRLWKLIRL